MRPCEGLLYWPSDCSSANPPIPPEKPLHHEKHLAPVSFSVFSTFHCNQDVEQCFFPSSVVCFTSLQVLTLKSWERAFKSSEQRQVGCHVSLTDGDPISFCLTGKLADLTEQIDAALRKGIPWHWKRKKTCSSHSFICAEANLSGLNFILHFFSFFFPLSLSGQATFRLHWHFSPKWNTTQISRKKSRKNYVNSCNLFCLMSYLFYPFLQILLLLLFYS